MLDLFEVIIDELKEAVRQEGENIGLCETYIEAAECGGRMTGYQNAIEIVKKYSNT